MSKKLQKTEVTTKKKNKKVYNILIAFFALVFLVALGILIYQLYDYYSAEKIRGEMETIKNTEPTDEDIAALPEGATNIDLAALFAQYPDFRGWITIEGTKINHPVVQSTDNQYYLRRSMDGEYHRLGTVFADFRNEFSADKMSDNTILYGHNSNDGSYFKDLVNYKELDYYESHKFIQFDTIYDKGQYVIIGGFMAGIYDWQGELFEYHNFINASGAEEFDAFLDEVDRRSYFTTNIDTYYGDELLTLSTCDYEFDDSRFVIVARKLRADETAESLNMTITAQEQPSRFMPDEWYRKKGLTNPNG